MLFSGPHSNRHCRGLRALSVLLVCMGAVAQAQADDTSPGDLRLAAVLRQLDAIERTVAPEPQPPDGRSRYHFDYARLAADLDRVRAGIRNYLSPSRAQPRDPVTLFGDYRQEHAPDPPTAPGASP